jgi:hypothetical protein
MRRNAKSEHVMPSEKMKRGKRQRQTMRRKKPKRRNLVKSFKAGC